MTVRAGGMAAGVGRVLLSVPFLRGSVRGLRNADHLAVLAARAKVPLPRLATQGAAVAMLGGAAALGSGVAPRTGALVLVGSLSGVTLTVHPFWRESDPSARTAHREAFVTNLALAGALLIAASDPRSPSWTDRSWARGRAG